MAAPNVDLGNVAGSIVQRILGGEGVSSATQVVLNAEGERVCYEGFIQRMYDNRWTIYIGLGALTGGLVALGAFIKGRMK